RPALGNWGGDFTCAGVIVSQACSGFDAWSKAISHESLPCVECGKQNFGVPGALLLLNSAPNTYPRRSPMNPSINRACPKCGGSEVKLVSSRTHHNLMDPTGRHPPVSVVSSY